MRALADAQPSVLWLDRPDAPDPLAPLSGPATCDLAIVGGGFTGLWAALQAVERGLDVVLLERETIAHGGTGRNGGFCDASLTHGLANGLAHFPKEIDTLQRLGFENHRAIAAFVAEHAIDCAYEANGELTVATRPHEAEGLEEEAELHRRHGEDAVALDGDAVRREVDSPTYLAGLWRRDASALVDPARLAWGLRRVALERGVRIHEHSPVERLTTAGAGVRATTPHGHVDARHAIVAVGAFPPLVRAIRRYAVPVYDYVLATEPLSAAQREAIGWRRRQGIGDSGNQFHYYRQTADHRIVFGGHDAVYHFGNRVGPELEQRDSTARLLAEHFFATFPQLEGVRFTHHWGGVIDTCSRFCVTFGTALDGRASYAVGYTGLGVGASRFGARVALDLLVDRESDLLRLELVRRRPRPFPPEPLRWAGIALTVRALARADRNGGRRGAWLRTLDRLGLGFDS